MENRIVDLEMKLTYQEDIIETLNQRVIEQQKQIDELLFQVTKIDKRLTTQNNPDLRHISQETPPPHY